MAVPSAILLIDVKYPSVVPILASLLLIQLQQAQSRALALQAFYQELIRLVAGQSPLST
jgi:hypothetical protein